ncbi:MAG TPA: alpha/beta hydrolase [Cellvibrio sp.]|nr:alpha/beta hydrolase [Cellvibrio sp.]
MSDLFPGHPLPIRLWEEQPLVTPDRERIQDQRVNSVDNPSLMPFLPATKAERVPAVLIFPGGGYTRLAVNHEGRDIAHWFNARGMAAFVVKYRLQEYGFPAALLDGLRAVRLVRSHADSWGIDPGKVGVVGFSAGGHVAASVALKPGFVVEGGDPLVEVDARPDFVVLGYPVIDMAGANAHSGSRKALLGEAPEQALVCENSLQLQVKEAVPPMFIFHGVADQAVPVSHSLDFFAEVAKSNQHSELHIYQSPIHGLGMIQGQGTISSWPGALELWLRQNRFCGEDPVDLAFGD